MSMSADDDVVVLPDENETTAQKQQQQLPQRKRTLDSWLTGGGSSGSPRPPAAKKPPPLSPKKTNDNGDSTAVTPKRKPDLSSEQRSIRSFFTIGATTTTPQSPNLSLLNSDATPESYKDKLIAAAKKRDVAEFRRLCLFIRRRFQKLEISELGESAFFRFAVTHEAEDESDAAVFNRWLTCIQENSFEDTALDSEPLPELRPVISGSDVSDDDWKAFGVCLEITEFMHVFGDVIKVNLNSIGAKDLLEAFEMGPEGYYRTTSRLLYGFLRLAQIVELFHFLKIEGVFLNELRFNYKTTAEICKQLFLWESTDGFVNRYTLCSFRNSLRKELPAEIGERWQHVDYWELPAKDQLKIMELLYRNLIAAKKQAKFGYLYDLSSLNYVPANKEYRARLQPYCQIPRRTPPTLLGYDRDFRMYWYFSKSANGGIYVEERTKLEVDDDSESSGDEEPSDDVADALWPFFDVKELPRTDPTKPSRWFVLDKMDDIRKLAQKLSNFGVRERELRKRIFGSLNEIEASVLGSRDGASRRRYPEGADDLTALKSDVTIVINSPDISSAKGKSEDEAAVLARPFVDRVKDADSFEKIREIFVDWLTDQPIFVFNDSIGFEDRVNRIENAKSFALLHLLIMGTFAAVREKNIFEEEVTCATCALVFRNRSRLHPVGCYRCGQLFHRSCAFGNIDRYGWHCKTQKCVAKPYGKTAATEDPAQKEEEEDVCEVVVEPEEEDEDIIIDGHALRATKSRKELRAEAEAAEKRALRKLRRKPTKRATKTKKKTAKEESEEEENSFVVSDDDEEEEEEVDESDAASSLSSEADPIVPAVQERFDLVKANKRLYNSLCGIPFKVGKTKWTLEEVERALNEFYTVSEIDKTLEAFRVAALKCSNERRSEEINELFSDIFPSREDSDEES